MIVLQLYLFEPAREGAPRQRRRSASRVRAVLRWVQISLLDWVERPHPADEEDDGDPFCSPVVHRVVLALQAEPPQTTGIRSIFDMAAAVLSKPSPPPKPHFPVTEPPKPARYGVTVREVGVTRHVARRHDETEEWAEKERQRRARQRVPRPTKNARTRSRKLLDLIGQEETT